MATVSPEERKAYAEDVKAEFGACPRCKSTDIDASDYDGDRVLSCTITCAGCGLRWTELYRFEQAVDFEDTA